MRSRSFSYSLAFLSLSGTASGLPVGVTPFKVTSPDTSHLNGDGTFATTVNFVGGTRQFAHATGGLVALGHFTATGGTEGTYSGEYCLGNGGGD